MKKSGSEIKRINFWQMMSNVIVEGLRRGQAPIVLIFFIILVMILKMQSKDVTILIFSMLKSVKHAYAVGYIIAAILFISYPIALNKVRLKYKKEIKRISDERNDLQKKLIGPKLIKSSLEV